MKKVIFMVACLMCLSSCCAKQESTPKDAVDSAKADEVKPVEDAKQEDATKDADKKDVKPAEDAKPTEADKK